MTSALSRTQQKKLDRYRQQATPFQNQTIFRQIERKYKARFPPPDYGDLADPHNHPDDAQLIPLHLVHQPQHLCPLFGTHEKQQTAYTLERIPGLVILPHILSPDTQRRLVMQIMQEYARSPNKCNLDAHYTLPEQGLWNMLESDASLGTTTTFSDDQNASISIKDMLKRMRWTTVGYQYDWSTKTYPSEQSTHLPPDLVDMTRAIVSCIDGATTDHASIPIYAYPGDHYLPEAGVINYYHLKDTLTAHVDQSELNMDAPLVSFSIGHSCVFLIGSEDPNEEPIALKLSSGDAIVMRGPCRKALHGVPRILEDTCPAYFSPSEWPQHGDLWHDYMSNVRINVNVRQVCQ